MTLVIIWACLAHDPSACREFQLAYAVEDMPPVQCQTTGAAMASAGWAREHPTYRIKQVRCSAGRERAA